MGGRSVADDLKSELENQSWSNIGANPKIKIGRRYGRIGGNSGCVVYEEDEDTLEYTTFTNTIVARDQEGIVEVWHKNDTDRQKMIDDVEDILTGSSATYNWRMINVDRNNLKNVFEAYIKVRRLI